MNKIVYIIICFTLFACQPKESVDLLVVNAKVYTVNKDFDIAKGFVVNDGKIVAVGQGEKLLLKYKPKETLDAEGKTIIPGLIDAHAHFYNLGLQLESVDLNETKSFDEVIQKIVAYQKVHQAKFIYGRGWDQNDWKIKEFPTKNKLDQLFPDTPVAITRIDGHAMLVNQKALDLAKINKNTKVDGGEIEIKNKELTGILIDNPMLRVWDIMPKPTRKQEIEGLLDAEKETLKYGLTTIDDAGLSKSSILLIDSLQKEGDLKTKVYAMVQNQEEDLNYFLNKGILRTKRLHVRSVKAYADGALGSRGAALKKPYADKEDHFGAMLISLRDFKKLAGKISKSEFQLNTHAIGDSANYVVLKVYDSILKNKSGQRWRVEHAQILEEQDFSYFKGNKNIIPSIQPTHATSDMYWAEDRIGDRVHNAYAYKKLLNKAGLVALGTDFPIEKVSPFLTFYAAVVRKDISGYPKTGFQMENSLSRENTLKGMTIWAAYANFEEKEKGSIEVGKYADFIILDRDIMMINEKDILKIKVDATYINGERVYGKQNKLKPQEVEH
ncbi:amidohydrolase [Mesonia aestuariivivens]|uniref:Amidohydrolase n=1 Tax=Mesonia aestuariivivens TaxID=2796128 RepID=A0ABS6VZ26_9FLAO|nr:amidohydrolase [Mesonia aestuariivivens]MBW2960852.1 amidohydrolase [Mesonia aestuariivivens]